MPVLLVRHAQALPRSSWEDDDRERTLSGRGQRQAEGLVNLLVERKPLRVLSSPYVRCVDTVAPLAAVLGVEVEPVDELAEGAGSRAVGLLRGLATEDVVLCSHGDVIPEMLESVARDGVDLGRNPRCAKASVWVLRARDGRFSKASYLEPPA